MEDKLKIMRDILNKHRRIEPEVDRIITSTKIDKDIRQEIHIINKRMIKKKNFNNDKVNNYKNEPAITEYYENGKIECISYCIDDEYTREKDKPARIFYHTNGNVRLEEYIIKDKYHRNKDKPAKIEYDKNGNIIKEQWYVKGERHRNDKPAVIEYYKNGNPEHKEYYRKGKFIKEVYLTKKGKINMEPFFEDEFLRHLLHHELNY